MPGYAEGLNQHYADDRLAIRLREALLTLGLNPDQLTRDDLAGIDQLHVGGRHATRQLADQAGLSSAQWVLDLGCGTGGSSRLLAAEYGVQVLGVDITGVYVSVAGWLSSATGLSAQNRFVCADARQLPLAAASFDAVWCQHVLMNLPDLWQALKEIVRVLKPDGLLLLHEVLQGDQHEPLDFPLPWARNVDHSHLHTGQSLSEVLSAAGLHPLWCQDKTDQARDWRQKHTSRESKEPTGLLTPQLIFGPEFLQMGKNLSVNLERQRLKVIQGCWQKRSIKKASQDAFLADLNSTGQDQLRIR